MTTTTHHGGRADEPARRGRVPGASTIDRGPGLLDGLRGPVPAWLRRLATTALLVTFVAWSLLLALGAESMYFLSELVGEDQALVMAASSVLLMAAGVPLLLLRHRRPVLVAGLIGALAGVMLLVAGAGNGYELAVGAALYAVAAARPQRTSWVVVGAVVVPLLVLARFAPRVELMGDLASGGRLRVPGVLGEVLPPWWLVTAAPFVVLAALGIAFGVAARTSRLRAAEAVAARAAEEEQRARATDALERARVAREMHDVIAHSITVMVALGGGAAAALDKSPEQARRALDELVDTGRGALEDVRRILGVLHSPDPTPGMVAGGTDPSDDDTTDDGGLPMAPSPGVEELDRLVERFRTAGLPVRTAGLAVAGLDDLDTTVQLTVYRIVQESLTNALRHAPGTSAVDVAVRLRDDAVEVVVTDRGPDGGTDAPAGRGSGRGLAGMRGRVAAFGGTLEAGPHHGGWRVRALLPTPATVAATAAATTNEGDA